MDLDLNYLNLPDLTTNYDNLSKSFAPSVLHSNTHFKNNSQSEAVLAKTFHHHVVQSHAFAGENYQKQTKSN